MTPTTPRPHSASEILLKVLVFLSFWNDLFFFVVASCPEFGSSGSGVVREAGTPYDAYLFPEYGKDFEQFEDKFILDSDYGTILFPR